MRRLCPALVASSLALLAGTSVSVSARAEPSGETIDGWPCKGCVAFAPGGDAGSGSSSSSSSTPRPLLLALHGDDAGTVKLFRALRPACEAERVILISLRCPTDLGCRTSYWQWQGTSAHDPGWIGAQIAAAKQRFAVDPARVYAAGYSGGATYLGWYAPTHPSDFAAVAHLAGGMPWGTRCPDCKLPVLFTLGATDPMLVPYTRPLRDYYAACGDHEIVWQTLPGVTHEGIVGAVQAGKGKEILAWLLAHRAACGDAGADAGLAAAAAAPVDRDASIGDASIVSAAPSAASPSAPASPHLDEAPAPRKVAPSASGCACDLGARRGEPAAAIGGLVGLVGLVALLATRRSRSP